ncbi:hypothetical protein ACTU6U_10410 [Microbacterium sp. A196]|uniref:hypothetical protein n=1 Tax=Microbacterium sp. A196 TaxID=3457320 RepID=UPI003FD52779
MTAIPGTEVNKTHPNKWTPAEQKFWGGPDNASFPVPEEILHVSVYHQGPGIDDLVRFYQTVLNLRYVFKATYGTWEFIALSHDDENHRIGIVNAFEDPRPHAMDLDVREEVETPEGVEPRSLPQRPCRLEHMDWRFRTMEDLLITARRVHDELGMWPMSARLSRFDFTIDYLDPDLNRVEMLAQFSATKGTAMFNMYRALDRIAADGSYDDVYLPLDMEKLIGHWEAGVPMKDLQSREWAEQMKAEGKL